MVTFVLLARSFSYICDKVGDLAFATLGVCAAEEYTIGGDTQCPRGGRSWPRAAWSVPGEGRCAAGVHTSQTALLQRSAGCATSWCRAEPAQQTACTEFALQKLRVCKFGLKWPSMS